MAVDTTSATAAAGVDPARAKIARFSTSGGARTGTLYSTSGFMPDLELDLTVG
jgi:hypothetical protein